MNNFEARMKLEAMKCQYAHIRKNDAEWEAVELAQEALRAQQERQNPQPCEYCDGMYHKNILEYAEGEIGPCEIVVINQDNHLILTDEDYESEGECFDSQRINFCPMCGRKLEPKEGV